MEWWYAQQWGSGRLQWQQVETPGLRNTWNLVVVLERVREPSSLMLLSRFDLNCCALPFCSNKHKTWEISFGFLIKQCHCFFPKLTPSASLRQVFDFTLIKCWTQPLHVLLVLWWYLKCKGVKKLRDSGPFWLVVSPLTTESVAASVDNCSLLKALRCI